MPERAAAAVAAIDVIGTLMVLLWIGWGFAVWCQDDKALPGYGEAKDKA